MKSNKKKIEITFIIPTFNESNNIKGLLKKLNKLQNIYEIEIIVVDDNSNDGTPELVRELAKKKKNIRLINRINRFGLSSAIKEGCINATNEIIAIMDADGQHKVEDVNSAIKKLSFERLDVVIGSRFLSGASVKGISQKRKKGSNIANKLARYSLPKKYGKITDYMTGCSILNRKSCINYIKKIDVNGFKFIYELLSISKGTLNVGEIPFSIQSRKDGVSKFDIAIIWDFLISLIHTFLKRNIPRRAISFGLVGSTGVIVQILAFYTIRFLFVLDFENALPISVICAASSNFLINNWLTFRNQKLKNKKLIVGLLKYLLVSSLPIVANVGIATSFYNNISPNSLFSQLAGIIIVFIWNYGASSKLVWNT